MNLLNYFSEAVKITPTGLPNTHITAGQVLSNGLNIVYLVAGIIAVVSIILAGFKYVTSAGDPAAITKAKNTILYSIIGVVVILLAFTVTWFVIGRF